MKIIDFISTAGVVVIVTFLVSIYPAARAARFYTPNLL
jgi:ABC-type lipoprotein release transport system permease subunit